jgi:hypothetical protein
VFKSETAQVSKSGKNGRSRAILGLAAAASLSVMAIATQASASQEIKISDVEMDTTYQANISGVGAVYSNGVQFTANFVGAGNPTNIGAPGSAVPNLFGFCVDIYHEIGLGGQTLYYSDNEGSPNPLATDNGGNPLSAATQTALTNLIDTGFILHNEENAGNQADTEMRLAAIQSAIWQVEVPSITVTVSNANLDAAQYLQYQTYFADYVGTGPNPYTPLNDANDRVFTITDINSPAHQTFAIGWPIAGVPEPTSWAMMITGFFGMGSLVRRQRKTSAAATA